jgi:hypothetical protein
MGLPWDKEERQEAINLKKSFFHPNEKLMKTKMVLRGKVFLILVHK